MNCQMALPLLKRNSVSAAAEQIRLLCRVRQPSQWKLVRRQLMPQQSICGHSTLDVLSLSLFRTSSINPVLSAHTLFCFCTHYCRRPCLGCDHTRWQRDSDCGSRPCCNKWQPGCCGSCRWRHHPISPDPAGPLRQLHRSCYACDEAASCHRVRTWLCQAHMCAFTLTADFVHHLARHRSQSRPWPDSSMYLQPLRLQGCKSPWSPVGTHMLFPFGPSGCCGPRMLAPPTSNYFLWF